MPGSATMLFDDISIPRTVVMVSIFAGSPTHSVPACAGLLLRLDTERLLREARRVSYGSPRGADWDRPRTVAPTCRLRPNAPELCRSPRQLARITWV